MAPTPSMPQPKILIIGAGVTGLALAQGLQQAGIAFAVYEAHPDVTSRAREWSMGLHWSLPLLEGLLPAALGARLRTAAAVDPSLDWAAYPNDSLRTYDGVGGGLLHELRAEAALLRVSRRKLCALCAEGVLVEYGHRLAALEYSEDGREVTAVFENGKRATGTTVVGADGGRSAVRKILFGPEKGTAGSLDIVHINVPVNYGDAERSRHVRSAHPVNSQMIHPDCVNFCAILDVPDPEKPETWVFQQNIGWMGRGDNTLPQAEKLRQVKERGAKLQEPYRSGVLWIPDDTEIDFQDLAVWCPEPWDSHGGRVTLAGDAAHAMTPYRGQGLNIAICDASNLVAELRRLAAGECTQAEAIQAYSDDVAERGAREVQLTVENTFATLGYSGFRDGALAKHGLERGDNGQTK